jgi:arsenate reductase
MAEIGIDISAHRSKTLESLTGCEFEYVVTLCRNAARACPLPHATKKVIHRNFRSPCEILKTDEEILNDFRRLRDELNAWIVPAFHSFS